MHLPKLSDVKRAKHKKFAELVPGGGGTSGAWFQKEFQWEMVVYPKNVEILKILKISRFSVPTKTEQLNEELSRNIEYFFFRKELKRIIVKNHNFQ